LVLGIFPEVSRRQAVELDLDKQSLESLVKKNVHPEARIYFEGDKIYVMLPLDIIAKYKVNGDRVTVEIQVG